MTQAVLSFLANNEELSIMAEKLFSLFTFQVHRSLPWIRQTWETTDPAHFPVKSWTVKPTSWILECFQERCLKNSLKLESPWVMSFPQGHKLQPWSHPKQSSPLVMWVCSRKRPISTSLPSPSFTPWSGINATPSLGFRCDQSVLTRTEMVLEGLGSVRWAWTRLHRSVKWCVSHVQCKHYSAQQCCYHRICRL